MSEQIFTWQPHLAEFEGFSNEWKVHRTQYETGVEQRRLGFGRPKGHWSFTFKMNLLQSSQMIRIQDEILDFYDSMKGTYDSFYLPSWEYEARFVSYSAATNQLVVATDPSISGDLTKLRFSATAGAQGNYVYVCKQYATNGQVSRITTLGSNVITLETDLSVAYTTSAWVQRAFKVTFADEDFRRQFTTPFTWEKVINFVEDIS